MKMSSSKASSPFGTVRGLLALLCTVLVAPGNSVMYAQSPPQSAAPQEQAAPKIPNEQLDSLVAPIALYPDPLLAQMLAASTYPLEIIQLQQWLQRNKGLKDKALVDAVEKENWDPSVQAMAPLPDAVKQLSENIKWTTDLGNAFLAQQGDVMDAIQRMRAKAQGAGSLKSNEQQKVEAKVVENKTVVIIEPANPQVVYIPSYNPTVVYGPPVYPYPPMAYPPPPPPGAYVATAAVSFGVGMMVGSAMHGGWGWGCGWGGGGNNTININNSNNFVNNANRNTNVNRANASGGNSWQHNPQHRGGTPYANSATANKYSGANRGAAAGQTGARQNQGQMGGRQQPSAASRGSGMQQQGGMNRAGGGGGGGDRVGSRSVSSGGSSGGAFGGGSGGFNGSSARSNSSRGSSSMGSRAGGGSGSRSGGGGRRR
jgi:hypothetical protein